MENLWKGEMRMIEMPTDIQFKDELRKELIMYREYLDLLDKDEKEKLRKKFEDNITRIKASLED